MSERALWTVEAMATAMRASRAGALPAAISGISIDTRTLKPGEAFFAIKGDSRDGHDFVPAALKAGAGLAVVSERTGCELRRRCAAADCPRCARRAARSGAGGARARAGEDHRRDRLGRQDQHQGGAAARAVEGRRDPRLGRLLQQSLGRAAVARALSGDRALRGVRSRHEPRGRDRAADQAAPSACGA